MHIKVLLPEWRHDTLTGLISFERFHEEIERIILSNKTNNYLMIYTDFENFKYFNYKYGYTVGDQLLKDFVVRSSVR